MERRAHDLLRWKRAAGEWFDMPPTEAVSAVKEAAAGAERPEAEPSVLSLFAYAQALPSAAAPSLRLKRAIGDL